MRKIFAILFRSKRSQHMTPEERSKVQNEALMTRNNVLKKAKSDGEYLKQLNKLVLERMAE